MAGSESRSGGSEPHSGRKPRGAHRAAFIASAAARSAGVLACRLRSATPPACRSAARPACPGGRCGDMAKSARPGSAAALWTGRRLALRKDRGDIPAQRNEAPGFDPTKRRAQMRGGWCDDGKAAESGLAQNGNCRMVNILPHEEGKKILLCWLAGGEVQTAVFYFLIHRPPIPGNPSLKPP